MPRRKKKGNRRKTWKRTLSVTLQTVAAAWPEIAALGETMGTGRWDKIHEFWIKQRTGYNVDTKEWDLSRALANNAISFGGPILIRKAMANVR